MEKEFLQILLDLGKIASSNIGMIEGFVNKWGGSAFHAVLECNLLTEEEVADALGQALQIDRIFSLENKEIPLESLKTISYENALTWEVLPLGVEHDNEKFLVLMADPTNHEILERVERLIEKPITISVSERSFVKKSINECYPLDLQLPDFVKRIKS